MFTYGMGKERFFLESLFQFLLKNTEQVHILCNLKGTLSNIPWNFLEVIPWCSYLSLILWRKLKYNVRRIWWDSLLEIYVVLVQTSLDYYVWSVMAVLKDRRFTTLKRFKKLLIKIWKETPNNILRTYEIFPKYVWITVRAKCERFEL